MRRQSSDKLHEGGQRGNRKRSSKILRRNMTFDHGREKNEHLNFYSREETLQLQARENFK
uniref:Uncharacterized protein n=1 Tax=Ciona savignyi TaxID=51511 RepID=H2Z7N7_CIOSA